MSGGYWRQGGTIQNGLFLDIGKLPSNLHFSHFSGKPGNLSFLGDVCTIPSLDLINFFTYNTSFKTNNLYLFQLGSASLFLVPTYILPLHHIFVLLAMCLFPFSPWIHFRILMSSHWWHPWPPSEIPVCCLWPGWVGIVVWEGGVGGHQWEDLIIYQFLSRDNHARSFLWRIRTGERWCINLHIVSGEGLMLK